MTKSQPQTTQWVLVSRCDQCGAAKSRASLTAYVYCDYCGALADYDFRKACEVPAQMPGPVYEELLAKLDKPMKKALAAEQRDEYQELQRRLFEAWVKLCPLSCPPRVAHADYRQQYVEFLASAATAAAFDSSNALLQKDVNDAIAALEWKQKTSGPTVSSKSFMRLLDAVIAQQHHVNSDVFFAKFSIVHPERVDVDALRRIAMSMMVQGWLPYVDDASRQQLIERCGLAQQYIEAQPTAQFTNCASCGASLAKYEGAQCCICEQCGAEIAVQHELACDGCGSQLSLPRHMPKDLLNCPHCNRSISLQGKIWPELVLTNHVSTSRSTT